MTSTTLALGPPEISRRAMALGGVATALQPSEPHAARSGRVFDGMSFLPRWPAQVRRAGLNGFISDVSEAATGSETGEPARVVRTFEACDAALDAVVARLGSDFRNCYVVRDGRSVARDLRCGVVLQFQSCEPIGTDLSRLAYFHRKGLRVLQITHNYDNLFGGACFAAVPSGLTALGHEGVAEMRRVGLVPDVSHASERTALDVLALGGGPVILSHGACRSLLGNPRCATDAVIRGVADSGGVMGVFMMAFWLTRRDPPLPTDYLRHVRHVARVGGIDSVGVANDFPMDGHLPSARLGLRGGMKEYEDWWREMDRRGVPGFATVPRSAVIPWFNSIDRLDRIREMLRRGGFRASEVDKIMGGNWFRVIAEAVR